MKILIIITLALSLTGCKSDMEKLNEAHDETVKRVLNHSTERLKNNIAPSPEYLAKLESYKLTSQRKEWTSEETGKVDAIGINTFRGKTRIHKYHRQDFNKDGKFEFVLNCFYANGIPALIIIKRNKEFSISTSLESKADSVTVDSDGDGKFDRIILMDNKDNLIDSFVRDKKTGLFKPISPKELYEAQKAMESVMPLMGAVSNVIEKSK